MPSDKYLPSEGVPVPVEPVDLPAPAEKPRTVRMRHSMGAEMDVPMEQVPSHRVHGWRVVDKE